MKIQMNFENLSLQSLANRQQAEIRQVCEAPKDRPVSEQLMHISQLASENEDLIPLMAGIRVSASPALGGCVRQASLVALNEGAPSLGLPPS
jgi:hypothetical protein